MFSTAIETDSIQQPQHLWVLMLSFTMIISISNWYDARLISLFGFVISPGTLSYPLSFLVADSITEVYGYKKARLAIWTALLFNLLFLLFGQLIIHLPSPSFATENNAFDKLLAMNAWIIGGSFVSFIIAEPFNSYLIAKLKIALKGQYLGIRFISSTIFAAFLDSFIFIIIAFHTTVAASDLLHMIFTIWIIKVIIEIMLLPFSIRITNYLKRIEKLDIYDHETNFSIFSLDSHYLHNNNHYFYEAHK